MPLQDDQLPALPVFNLDHVAMACEFIGTTVVVTIKHAEELMRTAQRESMAAALASNAAEIERLKAELATAQNEAAEAKLFIESSGRVLALKAGEKAEPVAVVESATGGPKGLPLLLWMVDFPCLNAKVKAGDKLYASPSPEGADALDVVAEVKNGAPCWLVPTEHYARPLLPDGTKLYAAKEKP